MISYAVAVIDVASQVVTIPTTVYVLTDGRRPIVAIALLMAPLI